MFENYQKMFDGPRAHCCCDIHGLTCRRWCGHMMQMLFAMCITDLLYFSFLAFPCFCCPSRWLSATCERRAPSPLCRKRSAWTSSTWRPKWWWGSRWTRPTCPRWRNPSFPSTLSASRWESSARNRVLSLSGTASLSRNCASTIILIKSTSLLSRVLLSICQGLVWL